MKRKLLTISIVAFLLLILSQGIFANQIKNKNYLENSCLINGLTEKCIIDEIKHTKDKILEIKEVVGDIYVEYYKHYIDGFKIMNDQILLQRKSKTNEILKYEKNWREINFDLKNLEIKDIDFKDVCQKEKVVFLEEKDLKNFYSFYNPQIYPVICWKVFFNYGKTLLYDISGKEVGKGITTPSKGFLLSGPKDGIHNEDCWLEWRENAEEWYERWTSSNSCSVFMPHHNTVDGYVSNPQYDFFYEIAHGNHHSFVILTEEVANGNPLSYTSSEAENAMENRNPMKFAFIGSCGGMDQTGSGSFSHAFRKGQTTGTVTVGYTDMTNNAMSYSLSFQDKMFYYMYCGKKTMKKAFDLACADYPEIIGHVKFVGDTSLKLTNTNAPPSKPEWIEAPTTGFVGEPIRFTVRSTDPEGEDIKYKWEYDSDDYFDHTSDYIASGEDYSLDITFETEGWKFIYVKSLDSEWKSLRSDIIQVNINNNNPPNNPTINGPSSGGYQDNPFYFDFQATDPNGDDLYYYVEWGDGKNKNWDGPYNSGEQVRFSHNFPNSEQSYTIKVKVKDIYDAESEWSRHVFSLSKYKSTLSLINIIKQFPRLYQLLQLIQDLNIS